MQLELSLALGAVPGQGRDFLPRPPCVRCTELVNHIEDV